MRATRTHQHGLALVELALSIAFLLSIAFGITEFGRAINQYNSLAKAARDASRFLSVRDPAAAGAVDDAKCMAVFGNPACGGTPLVPGLATAMVSVCYATLVGCEPTHAAQGSSPPINLVSVTIGGGNTPFTFTSIVPFVVPDIAFGPIRSFMPQVR